MALTFEQYAENQVALFDGFLNSHLKKFRGVCSKQFSPLIDAMSYSLEGGGKRLRPLLMTASAEAIGIKAEEILPAACALEFIHTYSLIHDDLPALDDDDTRRGKPSSHKRFGEAVAILAGDALLTEAFGLMASLPKGGRFSPANSLSALELLVQTSGVRGMVGGQLLDVTAVDAHFSHPEVEFIHIHKTGALILCAVLMPTRLIPMEEKQIQRLKRYGESLGLAFQISDDLLDSETSFRYSRGPRKKPKPTYADFMTATEMKERMNALIDLAVESVTSDGFKGEALVAIAEFIRRRKN